MMLRSITRKPCRLGVLLAACGLVPLASCTERTITITTDPPGALVWLNDVEVGRTPLETDFTFYGTYDVRLRLEGYEPVVTSRKASAPVHDWPGIDLVTEALPYRFRSNIAWHFDLSPALERLPDPETAEAGLIERARVLREQVRAEQPETEPER